MGFFQDTRSIRRALFDLLQQPPKDGAVTLLRYQLELADAIRGAELCIRSHGDDESEVAQHIDRLRTYGDGLAWLILHPHAIRQLAKNVRNQAKLIDQGGAFDGVLAYAGSLCVSTDLPVLIADTTNVIGIGDLLLVADAEKPTIVECKSRVPDTKHLMQGRIGRQVSRAMGTARYLGGESVKVFGEPQQRVVVETEHDRAWHWAEVEDVCQTALKNGIEARELSPGNWIWAFRPAFDDDVLLQVAARAKGHGTWQFGTSLGAREDLYPPTCAWPIEPELCFQLSEHELTVTRLVDYDAMAGTHQGDFTVEIKEGDFPLSVSLGDEEFALSRRFVYDVVYGFETVESCIRGIGEFIREIASNLQVDDLSGSGAKPRVFQIEGLESLAAILDSGDVTDDDLVAFPIGDLARSAAGPVVLASPEGTTLTLLPVGHLRTLRSRSQT